MAEKKAQYQKPRKIDPKHKAAIVEIGRKLEKLRINSNISASGLAKEVSISRNAYRQMEKGEIYFSTYNFLKILNYYNIDLTNFIKSDIDKL